MLFFIFPLLAAWSLVWLILRYERWHSHLSHDHDIQGIQKYHVRAVPRVGGVAIIMAVISCTVVVALLEGAVAPRLAMFLWCALPATLSGLIEDLTKRISPRVRMICALLSGVLASKFVPAAVFVLHIPIVDSVLSIGPVAVVFAAVAIAGVTNAVNIIDGFNGLASGTALLVLASIAFVAYEVGDHFVLAAALISSGAIAGFFVWNFPRGAIFLGDGGAYFIGYVIAVLTLVLVSENPRVSPWYGALVMIYPVFETLFSIFRRKVVQGKPAGQPDALHLHTLVHRRIARARPRAGQSECTGLSVNSKTSPFLWALCGVSLVPATIFWDLDLPLIGALGIFVLIYIYSYNSLINVRRSILFKLLRRKTLRLRG